MQRYKILKIDAKKLIQYCELKKDEIVLNGQHATYFKFDIKNNIIYNQVVKEMSSMDNCALYEQLAKVLKVDLPASCAKDKNIVVMDSLVYTLVILDFSGIYNLPERRKDGESDKRAYYLEKTKRLIEGGFILETPNSSVHMMAFDKNDNMSRECKITYIDHSIMAEINERLTVGIRFEQIELPLSKYYAYRGLYLSTSEPVSVPLTEATVVVVSDKLTRYPCYQKEPKMYTAKANGETVDGRVTYDFYPDNAKREEIEKPYDGQGLISPYYAGLINEELGLGNASSFQIRMPFAKGMLHKVDFHQFFEEFDVNYTTDDTYMMTDCFGIERDLKKAHIIMTESMFKASKWVKDSVRDGEDPMKYYFKQLEKYEHKLFIANTDLPYGKNKYVRLSYQMLNTLALSDEQFDTLINQHLEHIHNPIDYLKTSANYAIDDELDKQEPVWKRALFTYPEVAGCDYIKEQLINTQRSLLGQFPEGKITVSGQVRFLARDLPFMLVRLVRNHDVRYAMRKFKLFDYRFYMPQGTENKNQLELCYEKWYGFLRSPHLSRNEQCLLKPFVPSINEETIEDIETYNEQQVKRDCDLLDKYFGHLTGVVMVGNEALVPLALSGADFDGDLVEVIFDETVNNAIEKGVYKSNGKFDMTRELPYIKIPSNDADKVKVPENVPFEIIHNTFSNKIGLISNTAIAIGQMEYGGDERTLGEDEMTCARCTILTGLEIDAAKHGKHPDLSVIEKKKYSVPFLKFKREYEKLKKRNEFHQNLLEVHESESFQGKPEWKLCLKDSDINIYYPKQVSGTNINKLPLVFMDNLNFELFKESRKGISALLRATKEERKDPEYKTVEEQIEKYLATYNSITSFYKSVGEKIKEHNKCINNMIYILNQMYDDNQISKILEVKLPQIEHLLKNIITNEAERIEVINRINATRWHLLVADKKKECLQKEILKTNLKLDDSVWDFVYQRHCQGYKVLWYIVENLKIEFEIEELLEGLKKSAAGDRLFISYICNLGVDGIRKDWHENGKSEGIEQAFVYTLQKIQEMEAEVSLKIKALFRLTNGATQRRLFWNCFSWEDIENVITSAGKEVDLC